ncbi:hypothetical protein ACH4ZX_12405 [Streptomyces sp. NPDC020490]|uniref:hypothetical protein n=1 Tax=Streptomyces sp. NPDC020490 TaxID=3365078 RepID=UPI0037AA7465
MADGYEGHDAAVAGGRLSSIECGQGEAIFMYKLGSSLTFSKEPGSSPIEGETLSGAFSTGIATVWHLGISGHPDLLVHDRQWRTGERDIVTARPTQVPTMPKPLSALLGKKRAGVDNWEDRGRWQHRMAVYLVLPDPDREGWPKQKWCSADELVDACGAELLDALGDHGVTKIDTRETILGEEGRQRNRLCALLDPASEVAPVMLYVTTRVVPTLKHIEWL